MIPHSIDRSLISEPDGVARVIYLEIPRSQVVLFQAFFEHFEGLAVVRTLDANKGLLCVITTSTQLAACLDALETLRPEVRWRQVRAETAESSKEFLRTG
ncbi:MAG: hypothetical protein DCC75_11510 [Proteobacteria bacterium]|nr:MAG: hypothetical protein DCC75_11510 [Pseudomonadota bacterium]